MYDIQERKSPEISLYIFAFFITVFIFAIGVYFGNLISNSTSENIYKTINEINQRTNNIQLLFLLENSPAFCSVYKSELEKIDKETLDIGYKLGYIEDNKGTTDEKTKKEYFILETNSYLLTKKINEKCNYNSIPLLYFYSNKNCEICKEQGITILKARDYLVTKNITNIKIYSFDGDLGSDVVDALKQKYYISDYPTIIINEKIYHGYKNFDNLSTILSLSK